MTNTHFQTFYIYKKPSVVFLSVKMNNYMDKSCPKRQTMQMKVIHKQNSCQNFKTEISRNTRWEGVYLDITSLIRNDISARSAIRENINTTVPMTLQSVVTRPLKFTIIALNAINIVKAKINISLKLL